MKDEESIKERLNGILASVERLETKLGWAEEYIADLEAALQDAIPPLTRLSGHLEVVELLPRIHILLDTGLTPERAKQYSKEPI